MLSMHDSRPLKFTEHDSTASSWQHDMAMPAAFVGCCDFLLGSMTNRPHLQCQFAANFRQMHLKQRFLRCDLRGLEKLSFLRAPALNAVGARLQAGQGRCGRVNRRQHLLLDSEAVPIKTGAANPKQASALTHQFKESQFIGRSVRLCSALETLMVELDVRNEIGNCAETEIAVVLVHVLVPPPDHSRAHRPREESAPQSRASGSRSRLCPPCPLPIQRWLKTRVQSRSRRQ